MNIPVYRYGLCLAALAGYALLPMTLVSYVYLGFRLMLLAFMGHMFFPGAFSFIERYSKKQVQGLSQFVKLTLDIILSFQTMLAKIKGYIETKNYWLVSMSVAGLLLFLPNQLLFLTQYLSIYIASLFSYQLGHLYRNEGLEGLFKPNAEEALDPNKVKLNDLQVNQMKLVTMGLINIVTFMPLSYVGAVFAFTFIPFVVPSVAKQMKHLFVTAFNFIKTKAGTEDHGFSMKAVDAFLCIATLFSLLGNYKYEKHIINFLLAVYSGILLGQIGKVFYEGHAEDNITSSDQVIDKLYNSELVLSFWAVCLFYEVSSLLCIPRITFIAISLMAGVDINMPFNTGMSLFKGTCRSTQAASTAFKEAMHKLSNIVVTPLSCLSATADKQEHLIN